MRKSLKQKADPKRDALLVKIAKAESDCGKYYQRMARAFRALEKARGKHQRAVKVLKASDATANGEVATS